MAKSSQQVNRERTARNERALAQKTLFICGLTTAQVQRLRSRVFYWGAGPDYLATAMSMLPLASVELMRVTDTKRVRLEMKRGEFYLRTFAKRTPHE